MKVLFLPAWYPHRRDAMCGLFVRKHAQAAARHADVQVLYVQAELGLRRMDCEERSAGAVIEHYVYYPVDGSGGRAGRLWRCFRAYAVGLKRVFKQWGHPDIVHVQVLDKNAVAALWLKLRYGVPYVITEHWSRYQRGQFNGFGLRRLMAFIVKRAGAVLPVSEALGKAMRACGLQNSHYSVVRNVVDDFFFTPICVDLTSEGPLADLLSKPNPFVHICCFDEQAKNNFGLLRAVAALRTRRQDFTLCMIGTGKDWAATRAYAAELGLQDAVVFTGEVTPFEVMLYLMYTRFSVLFSRYETASVVVAESLSVGRPVVCSDIPAIAEIMDGHTGRMVPVEDEAALTEALDWMLDHAGSFDPAAMSQKAKALFSAETIGRQFAAVYNTI